MNNSRKVQNLSLHVALIGSFLIFGTQSEAQQAVALTDNFEYYSCDQKFDHESIKGFHNGVKASVKVYNRQDTVDVKMTEPEIDQCYVAVGRKGTMFDGVPFVNFYTSTAHFQCSTAGNCVGDLAGYDASMVAMNNGLQFTANTNRVDDLVNLCFKGGELRGGRC
jgi:hypothetical protein